MMKHRVHHCKQACTVDAALEDVLTVHERKASFLLFLLFSRQLRAITPE